MRKNTTICYAHQDQNSEIQNRKAVLESLEFHFHILNKQVDILYFNMYS